MHQARTFLILTYLRCSLNCPVLYCIIHGVPCRFCSCHLIWVSPADFVDTILFDLGISWVDIDVVQQFCLIFISKFGQVRSDCLTTVQPTSLLLLIVTLTDSLAHSHRRTRSTWIVTVPISLAIVPSVSLWMRPTVPLN